MKLMRALALLLVLIGTARADVWQRAIDGDESSLEMYESLLARGDEAALAANSKSVSLLQVRKDLDIATESYRAAAKVNPRSGEPHYRLGALIYSFFFECSSFSGQPPPTCQRGARNDDKAQEAVDAWDAFEARAPLDPRVNDMLLQRAILRTKLFTSKPTDKKLLEGALRDYQALLDRADGLLQRTSYLVLGNLAETHMMLGKIEDAIDVYKEAIKFGGGTSTVYGYAVALDRDERGALALTIIRDQGFAAYEKFQQDVSEGEVFYVPQGEEHYYFALVEEAFGNGDSAIDEWKLFIKSGAHPQFQARAKEHVDALLAKKNLRWRPPLPTDPFRGR